jgi:Fibronectin type III domain
VKGAVWAVVGVLALNVLLVGVLWIAVGVQHYRAARSQRRLESDWHVPTLRSLATKRRIRARRVTRAVLATTIVWASLVAIGVRVDRVVTSALGAAVHGTDPTAEDPGGIMPRTADRAEDGADLAAGNADVPSASDADPSGSGTIARPGDHGAPSTVAATATSTTAIRLAWTDVDSADSYEVHRSTDGTNWVTIATTEPTVTVYTDAGLASGTTYYYQVLAVVDDGVAQLSDVVSATTATGPSGVTMVTATATSSTTIDVTWTDVDGETGYRIERSTDGGGSWTTIATTGQDVTGYTDAGLLAATTYSYRVFATDADGESPPSEAVWATTADQPPEETTPKPADADLEPAPTADTSATGSTP